MTHISPTVLLFCCLCTGLGFLYFIWHSWSFDRFQSLVPTRRRAFKCAITWSVLISFGMFAIWSSGLAFIKYNVGYTAVPVYGEIPTPFPLWPKSYQDVTPALYYLLTGAFSMVLSVHVEEICFWIHLARSIRGKTSKTWLASVWFRLWVLGTLAGAGALFAVAVPFHDDPQQMEVNVFFVGVLFTLLFTITSFYVIFRFPKLIQTVREQGGSQVVLARLSYHRRLTKYRVIARFMFIIPFLTVSADGLTPHHDIAHHQFLSDLFIILGIVGLFTSTIISVYMFFPPPDSSIPSFNGDTADQEGLMDRRMTIEQIRSYYEPNAQPSIPVLTTGPDHRVIKQCGAIREYDNQQTRSIITPFPVAPSQQGMEMLKTTRVGYAQSTPSSDTQPGGSAYAWGLLAEHLRLPSDAMGLMADTVELSHKRNSVRQGHQGDSARGRSRERGHERLRSTSPEKPKSSFETQPVQASTITMDPPSFPPRSLPPPLRAPPDRSFFGRIEADTPYSARMDSEEIIKST